MRAKILVVLAVAMAILWGPFAGALLGAPGDELDPVDDVEAFAAEQIVLKKTRGGENVRWPRDAAFPRIIDATGTLEGYNREFQGKDRLQPLAPRVFEKIPTQRNVVYLTFDDGPYTDEAPNVVAPTEALLEVMTRKGATGTFFFQGLWSWKNAATVRKIIDHGSNVGNHTFHHPPDGSYLQPHPAPREKLRALTPDWQAREVLWGRAGILYALGRNSHGVTRYFRAPHGSGVVQYAREPASQETIRQIAASGHVVINGSLLLSDARANLSAPALLRAYRSHFAKGNAAQFRGEILWLHSGLKATVNALPEILDLLREKGLAVEALPAGLEALPAPSAQASPREVLDAAARLGL